MSFQTSFLSKYARTIKNARKNNTFTPRACRFTFTGSLIYSRKLDVSLRNELNSSSFILPGMYTSSFDSSSFCEYFWCPCTPREHLACLFQREPHCQHQLDWYYQHKSFSEKYKYSLYPWLERQVRDLAVLAQTIQRRPRMSWKHL